MGATPVIGSLYGQPTVPAGRIAHLVHGVVFALTFVGATARTGVGRHAATTARTTGPGSAYGVVLGVVPGAFVPPPWVNAANAAGTPVPFVPGPAFAGHVAFGLPFGAVLAGVRGAGGPEETTTDGPTSDGTGTDGTDAQRPTARPVPERPERTRTDPNGPERTRVDRTG
jgi:hypothetical protein